LIKKSSKIKVQHRFESKSGISINDVRNVFAKEKYSFARVGKSLNFVVNKGTEAKVIKCGTTIGDLYNTLKNAKSIDTFISDHEVKMKNAVTKKGKVVKIPGEKKVSKSAAKKIASVTNREVTEIQEQMTWLAVELMGHKRWLDPKARTRNPKHTAIRAKLHVLNDRLYELTGGVKEDKLAGLSQEDLGELQRRGEHRKAEKKAKKKERSKSKRGKNEA